MNLLKYFALLDQVEQYQSKLNNPEKFKKYIAKYSKAMEHLQIYYRLLFESSVREESREFSLTYQTKYKKNKKWW